MLFFPSSRQPLCGIPPIPHRASALLFGACPPGKPCPGCLTLRCVLACRGLPALKLKQGQCFGLSSLQRAVSTIGCLTRLTSADQRTMKLLPLLLHAVAAARSAAGASMGSPHKLEADLIVLHPAHPVIMCQPACVPLLQPQPQPTHPAPSPQRGPSQALGVQAGTTQTWDCTS